MKAVNILFLKNPIFLIIILASLIRLAFLSFIPGGMTNDELHFILNAKSVFYRFSDIRGDWNPLSLTTIPGETSSELTFLVLAPLVGILPTNLFTARLPFVILNVATIFLTYLIVKLLFNRKSALIVALVYALNPWSIYVSRTSFDAPMAVFFFTLTLYLLLKLKGRFILFAAFPALLAFYTYIGTKILLFPFMVIAAYYCYRYVNHRRYGRYYLILILFALFVSVFFALSLRSRSVGSRLSELTSVNSQQLIDQVDIDRNLTFDNPLKPFLSNRYVFYVIKFTQKYLNNFAPDVLFLHGDPTYLVSLWKHGYFYLFDVILLVIGIGYLYSLSRPKFYLILSLIALSPLPEAIRTDSIPAYAFHSAFQYPYLIILIGLGIVGFSRLFLASTFPFLLHVLLTIVYGLSFINLIHIYFFQYPLYQPEGFNFSRQIVSQYFLRAPQDRDIYILTREPESLFRNYLFFSNSYTSATYDQVRQLSRQTENPVYTFNNLHFSSTFLNLDPSAILISEKEITPPQFGPVPKLQINRLSDHIEMYSIYNDPLCKVVTASPDVKLNFFDLNIPKLTDSDYCSKYISKPNDDI